MFELQLFLNESINRQNESPLYKQIYDAIRKGILDRHLQIGTKLPSTRFIADEIKVSRNTVMNAFDQLIAEGYLITKYGSGTFVAEQLPDDLLEARVTSRKQNSIEKSSRKVSKRSESLKDAPLAFSPENITSRIFQSCNSAIDEFPMDIWLRCLSKSVRKMPRINLNEGFTKGYLPLREAIAKYLGVMRGVSCEAEQILIVSGSQQGLDLAARVLLDEGDEIMFEDPGYLGARGAFLGAGVIPIAVPIDAEGIDLEEGKKRSNEARAIYVTPSHQFPLGTVMSLSRRLKILEWANKNSAWIIEDDYDSEFRYDGKPLAALQGLDTNDRVIYVGTFSKVLFPSLRLGYLVVPNDLVNKFEKSLAFTTAHSSLFDQLALIEFINQGHFASHIRRMRGIYAERQKMLVDAIKNNLDDFLEIEKDSAGIHLIAWLKKDLDDKKVADLISENGIYTTPVSYYCLRERVRNGLVFGYSGVNEVELNRNILRLKQIFNKQLSDF